MDTSDSAKWRVVVKKLGSIDGGVIEKRIYAAVPEHIPNKQVEKYVEEKNKKAEKEVKLIHISYHKQ